MYRVVSIFKIAGIFIFCSSAFAQPDTLWTKIFGGGNSDEGHYVQQTTDGGFIIAGNTFSYGAGGADVWLIKTDAEGNEQWNQTVGGYITEEGHCVQQTSDGGYIAVGHTFSYGAGNEDIFLFKTDALGTVQWEQYFGGTGTDKGFSVQQTSDGGYIVAGWTMSFGAGGTDIWLIKTDASGNELWNRTFGGTGEEECYYVQQTDDGGYILAGNVFPYTTYEFDIQLIKTDANGNEVWTHNYGGGFDEKGYSVQQTSDGGYIITGYTDSFGLGASDFYLIKTDATGNETWSRTFGGIGVDKGQDVRQTNDGGYIITGLSWSYGAGASDVYLIKTDAAGIEIWSQTYGGPSEEMGYCVQQTDDGGYIIVGDNWSYSGSIVSKVYLIRVATESIPEVNVSLTPYNPPIQIPVGGGSFEFNIEVSNNSTSPANIDIWTMATLPNGSEYGPIINVQDFTAPAGFSGNRDRIQAVPASAPSGGYTYDAYVGIYPNTIWDEDHFEFSKASDSNGSEFYSGWNNWGESFDDFGAVSSSAVPDEYTMFAAYPNPFNPTTTISYKLQSAGNVSLSAYDVTGREVAKLVDEYKPAGLYEVTFDASNLVSGVYFVRLTVDGGWSMVRKMVLMK